MVNLPVEHSDKPVTPLGGMALMSYNPGMLFELKLGWQERRVSVDKLRHWLFVTAGVLGNHAEKTTLTPPRGVFSLTGCLFHARVAPFSSTGRARFCMGCWQHGHGMEG